MMKAVVGIVGTSLLAGTLFIGPAPLVGADTTPVDTANIDKSLLRATVLWQGVVVYQDATGKIVESGVLEVPSPCTAFFVSNEGHAVTAGHCFNVDQGRNALMQEFRSPHDPATVPDMSGQNVTILDVHGVMEDVDGTGSDPKPIVTVSQEAGIDDAVMGPGEVRRAHIIETPLMERDDVALLQVDGLAKPTPALPIALSAPAPGEAAYVAGYPMEATEGKASINAGTVSALHPNGKFGWPTIEVNAVMVAGMSGGPVLVNGAVVGTVSHPLPDGTNQATNTDSLRRILNRNSVPILDPAGAPVMKVSLAAGGSTQVGVALSVYQLFGLIAIVVIVAAAWPKWLPLTKRYMRQQVRWHRANWRKTKVETPTDTKS